ncbi:MAG: hypothetical protein OSB41_05525 [Kiritimatiellae bacterium]|nr:hypothetical protein [Kiritimatiellia bacterium]
MNKEDMILAAVAIVTAIIGYFIVSKMVDFFKKGSVWENKPPHPGLKDLSNPAPESDDAEPPHDTTPHP